MNGSSLSFIFLLSVTECDEISFKKQMKKNKGGRTTCKWILSLEWSQTDTDGKINAVLEPVHHAGPRDTEGLCHW